MYDDSDYLSGYHAPIEMIVRDIQTQIEDNCVKAVQQYGFIVDKEELKKALEYDRDQYEKGYGEGHIDGMLQAEKLYASPKGAWECVRVGNTNFITCSHCKEQFETENTLELWQDEYKFCHRCGADMRGGKE